jgi:tRNA pseudouridine-54 N-methylase
VVCAVGDVRSATAATFQREDCMGRPGIRDLVGRAMIDKTFLAELVREPAAVLAAYELAADERAAIMQAIARTDKQSERERSQALQAALMKRWAT